jgi:RHS repeat-associated protein
MNSLQSATEMFGSSQSWKQTFSFDRFGNRMFNTSGSNTTMLLSSFNADISNPTINTSNNRYSSGQGYSYDLAGNVTANAAGQSFVYDAEQHQIEVKVTSTSATVATYKYDGSGQRVKKIVGTEETAFIYDAMGKSVAEYVLSSTTTPDVRMRYLTQDQLGSPRVITNGIGQVQERHDYLAYGEEAGSSLSTVRTTGQKYAGTSAVRKRYTGYERDDESGLDYAQARYYNNAHGRFTSVDPMTASATIKNPQTFNRYSYALNSPYKFTDPLGLASVTSGVKDEVIELGDQCRFFGYGAAQTIPNARGSQLQSASSSPTQAQSQSSVPQVIVIDGVWWIEFAGKRIDCTPEVVQILNAGASAVANNVLRLMSVENAIETAGPTSTSTTQSLTLTVGISDGASGPGANASVAQTTSTTVNVTTVAQAEAETMVANDAIQNQVFEQIRNMDQPLGIPPQYGPASAPLEQIPAQFARGRNIGESNMATSLGSTMRIAGNESAVARYEKVFTRGLPRRWDVVIADTPEF